MCPCVLGQAALLQGDSSNTTCAFVTCRYSCTKWAGEVLMRQACEQLGLPVTAYRCAMILAHSW